MKIAILSKGPKNYSTKRLQEEATARGHNVQIINYTHCEARIEQNSQVVLHNGELLKDIDAIIPRIAWSYTRYGSAIVRQFEMQGIVKAKHSFALFLSPGQLRGTQL